MSFLRFVLFCLIYEEKLRELQVSGGYGMISVWKQYACRRPVRRREGGRMDVTDEAARRSRNMARIGAFQFICQMCGCGGGPAMAGWDCGRPGD